MPPRSVFLVWIDNEGSHQGTHASENELTTLSVVLRNACEEIFTKNASKVVRIDRLFEWRVRNFFQGGLFPCFKIFLNFAHYRALMLPNEPGDEVNTRNLWILGEALQAPKFQNEVIKSFCHSPSREKFVAKDFIETVRWVELSQKYLKRHVLVNFIAQYLVYFEESYYKILAEGGELVEAIRYGGDGAAFLHKYHVDIARDRSKHLRKPYLYENYKVFLVPELAEPEGEGETPDMPKTTSEEDIAAASAIQEIENSEGDDMSDYSSPLSNVASFEKRSVNELP